MLKKVRITTQVVFFLLFLWLFWETRSKGGDELAYPVKIFLDADPLIFILTSLASMRIDGFPYLVIPVILLTLFLGRVFCGWVCPLGTLHNFVGIFNKIKVAYRPVGWYWLKYALLFFLAVAALFSLNLSGIFDPLSLIIRSFAVSIYPALVNTMRSFFGSAGLGGVASEPRLFFRESVLIGAFFFLILSLNLLERRFWCRYLCPLGALLGLLSRYSFLRREISEGCNACGRCEVLCQGGRMKTECLACGDCDDACAKRSIHFLFGRPVEGVEIDLGRRRIVGAVTAGIIVPPVLKLSPVGNPASVDERLIRPPGALEEREFVKRCIKCGECMKVCITNGLQPTFLEGGVVGIWTPILVPRIGYCEYRCTLCGQVCPTGAIRRLNLEEKKRTKIGVAVIDRGKCLPYAYGIPCIVCEEVCPTPKKAIWLEVTELNLRDGKKVILKRPHVDPHLCVGCGICEAKCPILGSPAIYVISTGESRSKERQFLLDS